jgi:hypothetical protein
MQPYIQCIQCGLPVVFHQTIWHIHGRAQGVVSQHYLQDRVTMPHWYFTSDIASELAFGGAGGGGGGLVLAAADVSLGKAALIAVTAALASLARSS